jgi:hypothetical protein
VTVGRDAEQTVGSAAGSESPTPRRGLTAGIVARAVMTAVCAVVAARLSSRFVGIDFPVWLYAGIGGVLLLEESYRLVAGGHGRVDGDGHDPEPAASSTAAVWEVPASPRGLHLRLGVAVVCAMLSSILIVVDEIDMGLFILPKEVQAIIGALGVAMCLWSLSATVRVLRAGRPVLVVDGDVLQVNYWSGHRLELRRGDIVGIGPVGPLAGSASGEPVPHKRVDELHRRMIGRTAFDIHLQPGVGHPKLDTRLGDATVDGDLDEIRDALVDWLKGSDEGRTGPGLAEDGAAGGD